MLIVFFEQLLLQTMASVRDVLDSLVALALILLSAKRFTPSDRYHTLATSICAGWK